MTKNKIAAFLSIVCLMSLAACGGTTSSSSSKKPSSTSQSASTVKSSTSIVPVKSLAITGLNLSSVEGVASLVLTGTIANFSEAEAKFALGLKEIELDAAETAISWASGAESPADADYKYVPVVDSGNFTVTFNLTEITALNDGFYQVYAGAKGFYGQVGQISQATRVKAGDYAYYIRTDDQVGLVAALVLDKLPPVSLEEASVFKHTDEHIYAKVGGLKKSEITLESLQALTPFINLQQVGGNWTNTRINTFFFTVEEDKAYINFDINFVVSGNNYNTHLNLLENKTADAKMDNAINDNYVYNGKLINVYANPAASASDQNEFWGNLAFKVSTADASATEGKQVAA